MSEHIFCRKYLEKVEDDHHGACISCSHNSHKDCHSDCPHYPEKQKREREKK